MLKPRRFRSSWKSTVTSSRYIRLRLSTTTGTPWNSKTSSSFSLTPGRGRACAGSRCSRRRRRAGAGRSSRGSEPLRLLLLGMIRFDLAGRLFGHRDRHAFTFLVRRTSTSQPHYTRTAGGRCPISFASRTGVSLRPPGCAVSYSGLSSRRRRTARTTSATTYSTSSAVVNRPRPKRRLLWARSSLDAHRPQDIARLRARRRAGRAGADRHVPQAHQQRLALDVGEAQVQVARQPLRRVAVERHVFQLLHDAVLQPLAQSRQPLGLRRHLLPAQLAGHAEADDQRHGQRAAAQAALVAAAVEQRLQPRRAGRAGGRTGRRRPWGRTSCGPTGSAGRCPSPPRRAAPCRRPAPRRCGRGRRVPCTAGRSRAIGCSVPISLLAAITLTRIVCSVKRLAPPARP